MSPRAILSIIRINLKQCPGCQYDVTGIVEVVCPECGRDLTDDAAMFLERQASDTPKRSRVDRFVILPSVAVLFWLFVVGWYRAGQSRPGFGAAILFFVVTAPLIVLGLTLIGGIPHPKRRTRVARILLAAAWIWPILVAVAFWYV